MINSTSWLRWSDLLDHAMSLRPAERERWLAHLPPADAQAVARLLARMGPDDQAPEPVLPQGPQVFQNLLGQALAEPPVSGLEAGLRFGAWRLARQIGEGGMGQVWLAERADGLYQGQAAIKLLRSDLPRPDLAARFTRERVILSRLSHPGIARLLDAGIEADQAYLVLEYVDGTTLLEYARRHCPTVAQRVQLLLQIAQAVAYAHGQLVVHRDLKPSNVVVSPDGQPRLLDFGIASLLADDAGGVRDPAATSLTRQYGRGLTVDYAAPEQVTGDPCTAATDTFALGVLLFELLTGERPFQSPGRGRVASEHALLHDAPLRVSQALRRVAPSAAGARPVDVLQRAPGDLEAVIDKALQKSPSERYGSAGTLIEDLRAWLESRPVSARRLGRRHRARLWLRRNWLTASLSAAVMLALAGGVVAASWQATIARTEAARANAETLRAASAAAEADRQAMAARTALASADEQRAHAQDQAALAEERRWAASRAQAQAEREGARAAQALQREQAQQALALSRTRQVEATNDFLRGLFEGADPERTRGDALTARELVDTGARTLAARGPMEPALRASVGLTLGTTYLSLGRPELAEGVFSQALAAGELDPAAPATVALRLGRADALRLTERFAEAAALYQQALARMPVEAPDLSAPQRERIWMARLNWSFCLAKQGDFEQAYRLMNEAEAGIDRQFGRQSWAWVEAQNAFVSVASIQGNLHEVPRRLLPLLPLLDQPPAGHLKDAAIIRFNLAVYQLRHGTMKDAEASLATVHREFVMLLGPDATEALTARWHHASALKRLGRNRDCQQAYGEVLVQRQRTSGARHPLTIDAAVQGAVCAAYAGDAAERDRLSELARHALPGPDAPPQRTLARSLIVLAALDQSLPGPEPARRARAGADQAQAMLRALNLLDSDEQVFLASLAGLDSQYRAQPEQALAAYQQRLEGPVAQRMSGNGGAAAVRAHLLARQGDCAAAEPIWRQAREIASRSLDPAHALHRRLTQPLAGCGGAPRADALVPIDFGLL